MTCREVDYGKYIDNVLTYLELAGGDAPAIGAHYRDLHISFMHDVEMLLDARADAGLRPNRIGSGEVKGRWSVSMCLGADSENDLLCAGHAERLAPSELRKIRAFGAEPNTADLIRLEKVTIRPNGSTMQQRDTLRKHARNGEWVSERESAAVDAVLRAGRGRSRKSLQTTTGIARVWAVLAEMWAWAEPRFWSVRFSVPGSQRGIVRLCEAGSVKELFRLRDRDPGASRRAALLHWVTAHTRRLRRNHDEETEVRRHLRGRAAFDWLGLKATIRPSPQDGEA